MTYDLIIIGGGAAGFFAGNIFLEKYPQKRVLILEKSNKVLQKVKISGGGRCNVTNIHFELSTFGEYYPRGWRQMRKWFAKFNNQSIIKWFAKKRIKLKAEEDGRFFPVSNRSQTIIDGLKGSYLNGKGELQTQSGVTKLELRDNQWTVCIQKSGVFKANKVLVATGSSSSFFAILRDIGVGITDLHPSLFTFNIQSPLIKNLQGIAVKNARIRIAGQKNATNGAVLITHWGLSGPAILKLSAKEAATFAKRNYRFKILINWTGKPKEEIHRELRNLIDKNGKQKMLNIELFNLPKRLKFALLESAGIDKNVKLSALGRKQLIKLEEQLCNCLLDVDGKSTFKEEFVTCGGVNLKEINTKTLEHKFLKGLYFAGEVLNIDAITGGYNFQAAWTTAYIAAVNMYG